MEDFPLMTRIPQIHRSDLRTAASRKMASDPAWSSKAGSTSIPVLKGSEPSGIALSAKAVPSHCTMPLRSIQWGGLMEWAKMTSRRSF